MLQAIGGRCRIEKRLSGSSKRTLAGQAATGLALTDEAFHSTVASEVVALANSAALSEIAVGIFDAVRVGDHRDRTSFGPASIVRALDSGRSLA